MLARGGFLSPLQREPSSISLWLLALILFFIPQGVAVIHLSKKYPVEGGVYEWAKIEFGDFHGFVAGWCYWANNLVYYPSLLISVAAIAPFIIPGIRTPTSDKFFIAAVSRVILWIAIGFNVVGVKIGKWVQNIGAIGTFVPILIIAGLAGVIIYFGRSQTQFSVINIWPTKLDYGTLSFWSSMCFALAGLELASVMSGEIVEAEKSIPKATYLSGIGIVFVYLVGTIALWWVYRQKMSILLQVSSSRFRNWKLKNRDAVSDEHQRIAGDTAASEAPVHGLREVREFCS